MTLYDFEVEDIKGESVSLSKYNGKVLLVVNTASRCGLTPQLKTLEKLREQYKEQGFEVLAFPSNNFLGQEPLKGEAIQDFCELNYNTTFPIFNKINVIGRNKAPLYQYLSDKEANGFTKSRPKWNFHKYLIDREGRVVGTFNSWKKPDHPKIIEAIENQLKTNVNEN